MSDQDEDGVIASYMVRAVLKQGGIPMDDVMRKRLENQEHEEGLARYILCRDLPGLMAQKYAKFLRIMANMYQIAGIHGLPDDILDVLGNPGDATDEQVEAMLPYEGLKPSQWAVTHMGEMVVEESLVKALLLGRTLRTEEEQAEAAKILMKAVDEMQEEDESEAWKEGYSVAFEAAKALFELDAKRYRFRKQFLADGGAILFGSMGCQFRMKNEYLVAAATEEEALDLAIKAQAVE